VSATTQTSSSSSRGEAKRCRAPVSTAPPARGSAAPRAAPSLAQIEIASLGVMRVHQRPLSGTSTQRRRRAVRMVRAKLALVRSWSFRPTRMTLPRSSRKRPDWAQWRYAHWRMLLTWSSRNPPGNVHRNAFDVCMLDCLLEARCRGSTCDSKCCALAPGLLPGDLSARRSDSGWVGVGGDGAALPSAVRWGRGAARRDVAVCKRQGLLAAILLLSRRVPAAVVRHVDAFVV
jgi:hypothetical protein